MNLLYRNHRHGILWPFQNIFFSFPLPKNRFSVRRFIQTENCSGFKRDVFFPDQALYQKTVVGIKPVVRLERHSLFWKGFVPDPVKNGLCFLCSPPCQHMQPWGCHLLSARHVEQWQRCPMSSPHALMLPWEALFHCMSWSQSASYIVYILTHILHIL